ncbi:MAG: hypothetical protein K6B41_04040, partial [Butyrivibrio sp.]|nr:hypothetical protein [Butyrivibrio sp.]
EITYTCSMCGDSYTEEIPLIDHEYTSEVTKEATCVENGIKTYTCTMCGDTYTEEIPATGHVETEEVVTQEAGLFSEGERITRCKECQEILNTEVISSKYPKAYLYAGIGVIAILAVILSLFIIMKKKAVHGEIENALE